MVDPKQEEIAVKEARKLGVPVIAVIDTNCDPDMVDYKVPGNDDAIRAIRLFPGKAARSTYPRPRDRPHCEVDLSAYS